MNRPFTPFLFNDLVKRLGNGNASAPKLSIFLDFDGTLTPIAGHPAETTLSASMREILSDLNRRYPLAIISGRGLADITEKVGIEGLTYVGNHGMEVSSRGFTFIYDIGEVESEAIKVLGGRVKILTSLYDGAVLEEKGLTLSVHFRVVQNSRKSIFLKRLDKLIHPFSAKGVIKITSGKGLVEIRSTADWDKGSSVAWLMERGGFKGTVPVCVGDDETDEDAFRALRGTGLSIFVGRRKNEATLNLATQSEVESMLAFFASGCRVQGAGK